jgi:hypothetical protein
MLGNLRGDTLLERQGWIRQGALDAPLRAALDQRWVPAQMWHLLVLEHWLEQDAALAATLQTKARSPQRTL